MSSLKDGRRAKSADKLLEEIEQFETANPIGGPNSQAFQQSRRIQQSKRQRKSSPYTLSYTGQVKLCLWRGYKRLLDDPTITLTQLFGNCVNAPRGIFALLQSPSKQRLPPRTQFPDLLRCAT